MADGQTEKLHAACDECRTRKLKCSGDHPHCSRCARENIRCNYSPQKQMGRPRKRRREEEPATADSTPGVSESLSSGDPTLQGFLEFGMISPPDFDDFSGLSALNDHDGLSSTQMPSLHAAPLAAGSCLDGAHLNNEFTLDDTIDPALWDARQTLPTGTSTLSESVPEVDGPCTCLSIMYLTLTDLESLKSFSFPAVIPKLRNAMSTASAIMSCQKCPKQNFTAIQNVQSITALLSAIGERYHQVLIEIDNEADRLERTGEKKPFRIGDHDPSNQHLHTGTLDCPMGFHVELEAAVWKKLAKKALKTEVVGGGSNQFPFSSLLDQMEERQVMWHESNMNKEVRERMYGDAHTCQSGGATCLRIINQVRGMIERMNWD